MPIFVIAVAVVLFPIMLGTLIAAGTALFDRSVTETKEEIESKDKGYNPNFTLGHRIIANAPTETQLKEARQLAAQKAASLPRGANMRIGRLGQENLATAGQRLQEDPLTAVKIAAFHGWDGARVGAPAGGTPVAAAAPVAAAPAPTGKIALVPGKDYEYIEITDEMPPDEKRKARIANSKAKSKAMKAAKAAQQAGGVVPTAAAAAPTAAPAAADAAAPAAAIPTNIPEPNYIEITDDMSPDEVRKARIQNSKEKSKYNKALKAAGIDPQAVAAGEAAVPAAAPTPAAAPAPAATPADTAPAAVTGAAESGASAAADAGIPEPEYVEITDAMSPDEKRQARIQNAKARSAYNKALKAAGIDPKSVK